jgi:hypothetical protein
MFCLWEIDGTDTESCPAPGFDFSGAELLGSASGLLGISLIHIN